MSASNDIWALVPVKRTLQSKQRLAASLSPIHRQKLAVAMFTDVMTALAAAKGLAGILVVTLDTEVAEVARLFGARLLTDGADSGHTAAVAAGARLLAKEGRYGMLSVPGDVPLMTPQEVETVIAAHPPAPAFSIVAAHDGRGSNAVLLTPPDVMPLQFGDDSYGPHVATAERAMIALRQHRLPGIALDIDTPADLLMLRRSSRETKTSDFLAGIDQ